MLTKNQLQILRMYAYNRWQAELTNRLDEIIHALESDPNMVLAVVKYNVQDPGICDGVGPDK